MCVCTISSTVLPAPPSPLYPSSERFLCVCCACFVWFWIDLGRFRHCQLAHHWTVDEVLLGCVSLHLSAPPRFGSDKSPLFPGDVNVEAFPTSGLQSRLDGNVTKHPGSFFFLPCLMLILSPGTLHTHTHSPYNQTPISVSNDKQSASVHGASHHIAKRARLRFLFVCVLLGFVQTKVESRDNARHLTRHHHRYGTSVFHPLKKKEEATRGG